jgi:hypothetical protein
MALLVQFNTFKGQYVYIDDDDVFTSQSTTLTVNAVVIGSSSYYYRQLYVPFGGNLGE